ncbi:MAG TPA: protein kinase [Terriglobales bacterium]|nr:protein kinase [Terriglobales bacterium]
MSMPRQLGPFEVLERLGAGGMGEVFKARDQRLNRFVALKFLPEAASASSRERFQREALAIAAFNHPHICTLYEFGEHEGQPFLVMELLEGETLHARLARGPITAAQAVQWGIEIADALQAAHVKGILHRDLKPGNIFVTQRGSVKVLDFGLAQFAPGVSSADDATLAGTHANFAAAAPLTSPGSTLGTAAYMSPEQARGEALDARSDLFSLGVVLYQMASGQPPFRGRTSADLTVAILTQTPVPPSAVRAEIPARLDDIVAQCLEKDPDLRFQSAADLRAGLRRLSGTASASSSGPASAGASGSAAAPSSSAAPASAPPSAPGALPPPARPRWLWSGTAALALLLAAAAWWALRPRPPAPIDLQFRQLTFSGHLVDAVISPDGKFLAHVDLGPQGTSLHLLSISSGSDVEIAPPAAGCCFSPSFSPDGGQVYFLQGHALQAVPVLGGAVRTVVADSCTGAGFSPDGSQIAYVVMAAPLFRLMLAHADGSAARQLLQLPQGDGILSRCWSSGPGQLAHAPAWSPNGRSIAMSVLPVNGDGHVTLVDVPSGKMRDLGPAMATSGADLNWLPDGAGLVFSTSQPANTASQIWQLDYPSGRFTRLTSDLQGYQAVSLAASGQLSVVHDAPQYSVWVQTRPGGGFQQLPGGGANREGEFGLAWTRDGRLITTRNLGGVQQLWSQASDGSDGHAIAVDHLPPLSYLRASAANGQMLLGSQGEPASIWRLNGDGTGLTELIKPPPGADAYGASLVNGGTDVAFMMVGADGDQGLDTVPLAGGTPHKVWNGFIFAGSTPASQDGTRVLVIARPAAGTSARFGYVRLDGGQPQFVSLPIDSKTMLGNYDWTADGKAIVYRSSHGSADDLWALPLDGGKPFPLTHFNDLKIAFYRSSSDGRLAISRGTRNRDAVVATGLLAKGRPQ